MCRHNADISRHQGEIYARFMGNSSFQQLYFNGFRFDRDTVRVADSQPNRTDRAHRQLHDILYQHAHGADDLIEKYRS